MIFRDLKVKSIDFVIDCIPSANSFSAHDRTSHILGINIFGSSLQTFRDKELLIRKDDIYFLNQAEDYNVRILEREKSYSIHFSTYEPIPAESFCLHASDPERVIGLIRKIEHQKALSEPDHCRMMMYFYELCSLFNEEAEHDKPASVNTILLSRDYIDTHFRESGCLAEAASLSCVSRRRFNDLFRELCGETPNRYILEKKIGFSKKLLGSGSFTVSEVADLCGFGSVYYFSNTFKKHTGKTPRDYAAHGKTAEKQPADAEIMSSVHKGIKTK